MLRKLLLSTAIVAVSSTLTYAADAVPIDDPVPPVIDDARFDWTGLYIGGQAGSGHGSLDWLEGPNATVFPFVVGNAPGDFLLSHSPSGGAYGIFGGYNWQIDSWVLGIEGSYSWSDMETTTAIIVPTETTEIKSLWTIGPRIGIANDNFLIYAEGGYASAEIELTAINGGGTVYNASRTHHGYYLGAGIDWALNSNWILGLEYNHTVLGDEVHTDILTTGDQLDIVASDISIDTIMARLAYKF